MKYPALFPISGLLFALAVSQPGSAQETTIRTASLPYLTLKVTLFTDNEGKPALYELFSTNDPYKHSVFCMSGFDDVQYLLRDASGQLVAVNKAARKSGSDIISGGGGYAVGAPNSCKGIFGERVLRRLALSWLYPQLSPGTYSLQIILAPRGTPNRATLTPLTIKI